MFIENLPTKKSVLDALDFYQIPGVAAALLKDGKVIFSECYGYRDVNDRREDNAVRESTLFGVASISKSFTSALIAILVDEGKLNYDTPVKEYLPDFKMYDPFASEQVTLRDMLYHRTGLSEHDVLWTTDKTARTDLAHRLRYLKPSAPFRYGTSYNNTVYTLIGYIAEAVTGRAWDDMIRERIFEPLHFTDSLTSVREFGEDTDFAKPHYIPHGGNTVERLPVWNVDTGGPAAGLNVSLRDLTKWVAFHMGGGKVGDKTIISAERMSDMHRPGMVLNAVLPWGISAMPDIYAYGMAWFNERYRGLKNVWHAGEINGYSTTMGFLPDEGIGYVVMTNRHKPLAPFLLSMEYAMIDSALGISSIDWLERLQSEKENYGFFHFPHTLDLTEDLSAPSEISSYGAEDYMGKYSDLGYGEIEILPEGDGIKAIYQGVEQRVERIGGDLFKLIGILEDVNWLTVPMEFVTDAETGGIKSVKIKLDPETDAIEFVRIHE